MSEKTTPSISGGERPGSRETMRRMEGALIQQGVPPERARQEARDAALRSDQRKEGTRR